MLKVNKNFMYLGVALLLGVIAAIAAVSYIRSEVEARAVPVEQPMTAVAVPVTDLAVGTVIDSEQMLAVREIPADMVPAEAVTPDNYASLMGRMLRAPVRAGAPFSSAVLVPVYDRFSSVIQAGSVGYTLTVDQTNSISGMVTPGDHIDILLTIDQGDNGTRVMPLLEDILVLATGTRIGDSPIMENEAGYSTVTLELEPLQAERLAVADKAGDLQVILRQRHDRGDFQLGGLTERDLLRTGGGRAAGVEFIIGGN